MHVDFQAAVAILEILTVTLSLGVTSQLIASKVGVM
jgi:hypothetical protein